MKLPLTLDEIVRKLATLPQENVDRWMRENGYRGMAAVALSRKVRAARATLTHKEG